MTTRPGYIWSGTEWVSIGQEAVVAPVKYQASAPSTPSTGDIWIDSDDDVPGIDTSQFLRWRKTAAGGETSVSGTDDNGLTLQYTANYEQVYLNGVLLVRGQDYTATNGTSITGLTALAANDVVEVFGVVARVVGDVYTQAQADAKYSLQTTTGLVLLNTTDFSAVSTVNVNNCFSSAYANYKILINITTATVNDANLNMRMRVGGVDNSTASSYQRQYLRGLSGTASADYTAADSVQVGQLNTTVNLVSAMDILNPFATAPTRILDIFHGGSTSTTPVWISLTGCYHNQSTSYDGFSLIPASGNITGTIKVYGYK